MTGFIFGSLPRKLPDFCYVGPCLDVLLSGSVRIQLSQLVPPAVRKIETETGIEDYSSGFNKSEPSRYSEPAGIFLGL